MGYIDSDRKRDYSEQPYRGKYFSIYFDTPPKSRNSIGGGMYKEAIIQTSNFKKAMKVVELISASLTLINAELHEADHTSILPFSRLCQFEPNFGILCLNK